MAEPLIWYGVTHSVFTHAETVHLARDIHRQNRMLVHERTRVPDGPRPSQEYLRPEFEASMVVRGDARGFWQKASVVHGGTRG